MKNEISKINTQRKLIEIQLDWVKKIISEYSEIKYSDILLDNTQPIQCTIADNSHTYICTSKFPNWTCHGIGFSSHDEFIKREIPRIIDTESLLLAN